MLSKLQERIIISKNKMNAYTTLISKIIEDMIIKLIFHCKVLSSDIEIFLYKKFMNSKEEFLEDQIEKEKNHKRLVKERKFLFKKLARRKKMLETRNPKGIKRNTVSDSFYRGCNMVKKIFPLFIAVSMIKANSHNRHNHGHPALGHHFVPAGTHNSGIHGQRPHVLHPPTHLAHHANHPIHSRRADAAAAAAQNDLLSLAQPHHLHTATVVDDGLDQFGTQMSSQFRGVDPQAAFDATMQSGIVATGSKSLKDFDDPSLAQREDETIDPRHNIRLKNTVMKLEQAKMELENLNKRTLENMDEIVKRESSDAAGREAADLEARASFIRENAINGNMKAIIPGTNTSFEQAAEKLEAQAAHQKQHQRNVDLFALEKANAALGLGPPTMGRDIMEEGIKNAVKVARETANEARSMNRKENEEARGMAEFNAEQLQNQQKAREEGDFQFDASRQAHQDMAKSMEASDAYSREAAAQGQAAVSDIVAGQFLNDAAVDGLARSDHEAQLTRAGHLQKEAAIAEAGHLRREAAIAEATAMELDRAQDPSFQKENNLEMGIAAETASAMEVARQNQEAAALDRHLSPRDEAMAVATGVAKNDNYGIVSTIPDDADSVAITNGNIKLPLKIFGSMNASKQAEASAIALQNKIISALRGKVTKDNVETRLNTIHVADGFLNIPESAEKLSIDSGRVYYSDADVEAMKKLGKDVSHLESVINSGETNEVPVGMKYYVADASNMELALPSPSNPNPARILVGKGKTLDIDKANGIDIEKGEMKMTKWSDYSRGIHPQVNRSVQAVATKKVFEPEIDDSCVHQALKSADALTNSISEIIVNPDGKVGLRITPQYGVSENIDYQDAIYNLNRIKESCRITHGQDGANILEDADLKSVGEERKMIQSKSLNLLGDKDKTEQEDARVATENALETASNLVETHNIVKTKNAFDNKENDEKKAIVTTGEKKIEAETGMTAQELKGEKSHEEVTGEMEAAKEAELGITSSMDADASAGIDTEKAKELDEEFKKAAELKKVLNRGSEKISKELFMTNEEFLRNLNAMNISDFQKMLHFAANPSDKSSEDAFNQVKDLLKLRFGTNTDLFIQVIFDNIKMLFGFDDPLQIVVITKKTQNVPYVTRISTNTGPNGTTALFRKGEREVSVVKKVPINSIVPPRSIPANIENLPAGIQIEMEKNKNRNGNINMNAPGLVRGTAPPRLNVISGGEIHNVKNGGKDTINKLSVGQNGMIVGDLRTINRLFFTPSIGNITKGLGKNGIRFPIGMIPIARKPHQVSTKTEMTVLGGLNNCPTKDCFNAREISFTQSK